MGTGVSKASIRRRTNAAARMLRRAAKLRVSTVLGIIVNAGIVAIPVLLKPGWSHAWYSLGIGYKVNALGLWGMGVIGRWAWQTVNTGKKRAAWNLYWSGRAINFAGNIAETAAYMRDRRKKGGRPISPERIQAGILQQIADLTKELTDTPEDVTIQACLLVPENENGTVVALKTITYNKLSGSRRYSRILLETAGAATATFSSSSPKVVPDTMAEPYRQQFAGRPYRSVMAFPITIGDEATKPLAIVSVDASKPEVFTEEVISEFGIEDAISPFVKLLGLLLIADTVRR